MTVKELKEALDHFDDNLIVLAETDMGGYFPVKHIRNVCQGVNEFDGAVFLSDYEEDIRR